MLFPEGGLAVSVASTVWVGVMLICLLNLRLGWTLTGMVIPGFLIPLFMVKPIVAFVDIAEGIIAYLLVRGLSDIGVALKKWGNFVGRDRFFTLVLAAVLIRLIFDGYLLGATAEWLQTNYNYSINYYAELNGFGLIISALIANFFWRSGIKSSFIPFAITLLLTYLLTRYFVMEVSNFRIAQVASLFLNLEEVFPDSPKTYIILLTTTFIATRMTSRYGWNYGGILIAGLLSIRWYNPWRLLMTFIESFIIYFICDLLLKTKFFASKNIINARKTILFFNVGICYKLITGYFIMTLVPEERVLSYYGFGYLISTFIALRMHHEHHPIRAGIMIYFTSLVGMILGSLIALCLFFMTGEYLDKNMPKVNNTLIAKPIAVQHKEGHLLGVMEKYKYQWLINYKDEHLLGGMEKYKYQWLINSRKTLQNPSAEELILIDKRLLKPLINLTRSHKDYTFQTTKDLEVLNGYANSFGLELSLFDDLTSKQKLLILGPEPGNLRTSNWGIYIYRFGAETDQILEVPRPFDEASVFDISLFLFQRIKAQHLLIGGTSSNANKDMSADLTRANSKYSFYNLVSQALLREHEFKTSIIQMRGFAISANSSVAPNKDLLIAFSDGAIRPSQFSNKQKEVIKIVENIGAASYGIVNQDEKTTGYEVGQLFLAKYLLQTPNNELAILWLSPTIRGTFRTPESNLLALSMYAALGINDLQFSLQELLQNNKLKTNWHLDPELKYLAEKHVESDDITLLKLLVDLPNYTFKHLILDDDGRDYLAIFDKNDNSLLALLSIAAIADNTSSYFITKNEDSRLDLSLKRWIFFREP